MGLIDQYALANNGGFQQLLQGSLVHNAVAIQTEVTNEVQTVAFTGTVTGGTFTLTYAGQTTSAIPFNSSAPAVQTALQALTTVGANNCFVTGGPGPASFVVTFSGQLGASSHSLLTFSAASLTGTTPGMTVTRTTAGVSVANHAARSALASKVLANPVAYVSIMALGVTDNATIQTDFPSPSYARSGSVTASQADNDINFTVASIWSAYS